MLLWHFYFFCVVPMWSFEPKRKWEHISPPASKWPNHHQSAQQHLEARWYNKVVYTLEQVLILSIEGIMWHSATSSKAALSSCYLISLLLFVLWAMGAAHASTSTKCADKARQLRCGTLSFLSSLLKQEEKKKWWKSFSPQTWRNWKKRGIKWIVWFTWFLPRRLP